MKIAVRALVLGMLITGFAADHMLASKSTTTNSKTTLVASTNAVPLPCSPDTCGW